MLGQVKRFFGGRSSSQPREAEKAHGGGALQAASQLPPSPPPKVRPGQRAYPSYLKTVNVTDNILPQNDRRLINKDLTSYRNGVNTQSVMRDFAASSPDLSAAVFAYLRTAITGRYTAVARNPDGTANPEATALTQQLIARFDVLTDYAQGFSGITSMQSNSESCGKELLLYGATGAELVLDKARLPYRIQPISVTGVKFKSDGLILRPVQRVGGTEIDLDIPTFFYVSLDQDLLEPYAASPLEPVLKPALFSEDFMNDVHRVVKKAIHPRQTVKIDEEKFRENIPAEVMGDPAKLKEYQDAVLAELQNMINGLKPEDALVYFDTIEVSLDNNGNISLSNEYDVLQGIANSRLATGAKVLPAVLGHEVGSSNVASTSSLLFMKNATVIKQKLDELYSRIMTLAVRLFGYDVYVTFKYADIDLRPDSELESFRQTKQTRLLELLSLGLVTDEEVALEITGHLPPAGYKPLAGTMFKMAAATTGNPYNGQTNDGSTLNQNLKSDAPATARGKNTNKQGNKAENTSGWVS